MTEHDLSTLVRDHVSSDEPPFAGPEHAIARGRRAVRTRRLAAGVGVAAVLAVAGALVVPQFGSAETDSGPNGIDSARQEALDNYDAEAMPRILEETSRTVLSRSAPGLGPADFAAFAHDGSELGPGEYDRAGGMSLHFGGESDHRWVVLLDHAAGETEAVDHEQVCRDDLRNGDYIECAVKSLGEDTFVVHRVVALQGGESGWAVVNVSKLDTVDPDTLWFEHESEVIQGETFLTRVRETVRAPTLQAAERELRVPWADLDGLAADPDLVIPLVPEDQSDVQPAERTAP